MAGNGCGGQAESDVDGGVCVRCVSAARREYRSARGVDGVGCTAVCIACQLFEVAREAPCKVCVRCCFPAKTCLLGMCFLSRMHAYVACRFF